jgi:hypothetical protein
VPAQLPDQLAGKEGWVAWLFAEVLITKISRKKRKKRVIVVIMSRIIKIVCNSTFQSEITLILRRFF